MLSYYSFVDPNRLATFNLVAGLLLVVHDNRQGTLLVLSVKSLHIQNPPHVST